MLRGDYFANVEPIRDRSIITFILWWFYVKMDSTFEIRQSKINSHSVAGPMGQMNRRPSV